MSAKPGAPSKRPLWAEEFSVHADEDAYVLRRQFTKFLALTSLGMLVGNGWILARSLFAARAPEPPRIRIARAGEVPVGGVKLFRYPTPDDPAILLRDRSGALGAFSQVCTHLSCAVYYSAEADRLECPCHDGYFSAQSGDVIQGPPPRRLPRIRLEQDGDVIIATGVDAGGSE